MKINPGIFKAYDIRGLYPGENGHHRKSNQHCDHALRLNDLHQFEYADG